MKNILFICNVSMIDYINNQSSGSGGWIIGVLKELSNNPNYCLSICYPAFSNEIKFDQIDGINYYSFYQERKVPNNDMPKEEWKYKKKLRDSLKSILNSVNADLLFVFGTEFLHSQLIVEEFNNSSKTVIHIQGLVTYLYKHCLNNIPLKVKFGLYPSTILRGFGIKLERDYYKKSLIENETIKLANNILGRTEWDKACSLSINPNATYYKNGEILRDCIYNNINKWNRNLCKPYTIYFSQGASPNKGLFYLLKEMPGIIKLYPSTHLYIGGKNPIGKNNLKNKLTRSSYGYYLHSIIKKYKLSQHVTFLGNQSESQVVDNLLNSNVFISSSNIENSSNSLGEAITLGVPVISSDVGGIKDIVFHGENGYLYPLEEPYMIRYYISKVFNNEFKVKHNDNRENIFDRENNKKQLNRIVQKILFEEESI